ncbi:hypothetical protein HNQ51_001759 [Inhella inkyongensis]|uniref:Uncharacterized protein n=1 Tax=Inhella inkyongensis TaxID=392593 RepID=A0A840S2B0_9BURK|nr:hypothetical protein [Inhella inkyongensis]MBB5204445.1 hypothetical protein [Inhella inkyongensis]
MPWVWQIGSRLPPSTAQVDVPGNVLGRLSLITTIERLPSEPIGTFTLSLTNLVVGSAIRIEVQSTGALIEFRTAASSSEVFSVPTFGGAAPADQLRIKVRKGTSAPYYIPFDTLTTAFLGSGSVYVSQIPD